MVVTPLHPLNQLNSSHKNIVFSLELNLCAKLYYNRYTESEWILINRIYDLMWYTLTYGHPYWSTPYSTKKNIIKICVCVCANVEEMAYITQKIRYSEIEDLLLFWSRLKMHLVLGTKAVQTS